MPSYKLTYFNAKGRAEVSRLLFAAAGQKYEDVRIEFKDWPAKKASTPQGTLPVLEVDGKPICQSNAIARFLAREFKLYGKTNMDMALVDQMVDTCLDMTLTVLPMLFKGEEGKKELETFLAEKMPRHLKLLEDLIKQSGKNGFAVGSSISLADLALYSSFDYLPNTDFLASSKILQENRKAVEALPRMKTYLAARDKK